MNRTMVARMAVSKYCIAHDDEQCRKIKHRTNVIKMKATGCVDLFYVSLACANFKAV